MKHQKKIYLLFFICLFFVLFLFNLNIFSFYKSDLTQEYARLFTQAKKLQEDGEFEKSIRFFEKSLNIARKIPSETKECDSLIKLGIAYWNIGEVKESSEYYKLTLKLAQKLNLKNLEEKSNKALKIYKSYNEGKNFRRLNEFQKSIESFQQAINISKEIESKEHELKCLRQMSFNYENLNKLKEFYSLNEKALKIAQSLNHRIEEGRCLTNIGNYYLKLDNYSEALNYLEQALIIAQVLRKKIEESVCLSSIGIIYENIGNYEKALDYLKKALEIDKQLGKDIFIAMDLNNIGATFRTKGLISKNNQDFLKALDNFYECLKLTRKTGYKRAEVEVLNNIGTVHTDLENYHKALEYFQSGYKLAEEIKDVISTGMILNNIGIVNFYLGDYEKSTEYYERAINLAVDIGGEKILWEAYLERAKAFEKQDKFSEAIESYKESIKTIENIRSRIKLEELKASYLAADKRIEPYHNLIHLLVKLYLSNTGNTYGLEAFNYLERAKARAFLDSLELSQVDITQGVDAELLNHEKELMKDISNIYTRLLAEELSREKKEAIHEELKNNEDKLESLKREMRIKSPAYADLRYPEIISLVETQKKLLNTKTAFFAYSISEENSYAFVITRKDLRIFPIPPRDIIQKQVTDYLKVINDKENQNFESGHELFKILVLPGLDKKIKTIIFIPDDILHFLPFETLITHKEKRNWLINNYKIAYAPSISSLSEIIRHKKLSRTKPQMDILAFGDPHFGQLEKEENGEDIFQEFFSSSYFNFFRLKYSGLEIDKISDLFKKSNTFQRELATEEQLKEHRLRDYKIIHFATHSILDDKKPARSSIVLTLDEDPTEDGFLQMREIYNLKLNSDLVTLSSCQTGLGRFTRGEGIEGINRAFFYAGTSSVLMSLWAVNDEASYQLMERFYFHLRSSESIMSALRKAKLEMINSGILSHPYYWAGFVISGKADEIIFSSPIKKLFIFGIFLLLAVITLIVLRNIRKRT
ncbi:MAG: CHAT domain-containing protein [Candidatus Aminicenantes bacterium]|nr:CHAT domain-containing protein [Candidatus Aminicenantes bacterium]